MLRQQPGAPQRALVHSARAVVALVASVGQDLVSILEKHGVPMEELSATAGDEREHGDVEDTVRTVLTDVILSARRAATAADGLHVDSPEHARSDDAIVDAAYAALSDVDACFSIVEQLLTMRYQNRGFSYFERLALDPDFAAANGQTAGRYGRGDSIFPWEEKEKKEKEGETQAVGKTDLPGDEQEQGKGQAQRSDGTRFLLEGSEDEPFACFSLGQVVRHKKVSALLDEALTPFDHSSILPISAPLSDVYDTLPCRPRPTSSIIAESCAAGIIARVRMSVAGRVWPGSPAAPTNLSTASSPMRTTWSRTLVPENSALFSTPRKRTSSPWTIPAIASFPIVTCRCTSSASIQSRGDTHALPRSVSAFPVQWRTD